MKWKYSLQIIIFYIYIGSRMQIRNHSNITLYIWLIPSWFMVIADFFLFSRCTHIMYSKRTAILCRNLSFIVANKYKE